MRLTLMVSLAMCATVSAVVAQTPPAKAAKASSKAPKPPKPKGADSTSVAKFFREETPITVTFTTNVGRLRGDKNAATAPWRPGTFSYVGTLPDTSHVTIPVRVKTRGIWRLKNCQFPPVRLNFTNVAVKKTVFHSLDKPKLINHCRDEDTYEQYVLQEFQLYRIYRLLTPVSHAVRLLRMTYADSGSGKVLATRYAYLQEEPTALAERNLSKQSKLKGARPDDFEPFQSALVGVFQYMIGNTDFAFGALHNVEIYQRNDTGDYLPVVYDFDFSGAVNARYATVDPQLRIHSVRDRLYRGYCVPNEQYPKVFALFNAKKDSIYALYKDSLGSLLKKDIADETLKYFDDFYKTINNPRSAKNEIIDACIGGK
jgi:hypothetical protein